MSNRTPPDPRSSKRPYWLLASGVAIFVLAFTVAERIVGPVSRPVGSSPSGDRAEGAGPPPPVVSRRPDGAVEIRFDFLHKSTISLGNDADEQALYDCLVHRIDEAFGAGTSDWTPLAMRSEVRRMRVACMESLHVDPVSPIEDR